MRKLAALLVVAGLVVGTASAERIMDQMGMIGSQAYDAGNGNHLGGEGIFGSTNDLQLCDDFNTTATGFVINEVEVGNLTFGIAKPAKAWVRIFSDAGGKPSEAAVAEINANVTTNTNFTDTIFGLVGVRSTVSGLNIGLNPGTHYYIDVQTQSTDWAYTARDLNSFNGDDSYGRDGPNGQGGYFTNTWVSMNNLGFGKGDSAYRVEATPEPTTLGLLALGALGLIRRR
jgi:hypothetical protein